MLRDGRVTVSKENSLLPGEDKVMLVRVDVTRWQGDRTRVHEEDDTMVCVHGTLFRIGG